jgi:hypothetical protein
LADDHAQLVLGVGLLGLGGRWDTQGPHEDIGSSVEEPDAGQEDVVEKFHERRHDQRSPLRLDEGDALGSQLTEYHVQKRDDPEAYGEGDGVNQALRK